ncbi:MAG TPA: prepilin-type N-terminal cleavage/methylation domain-containing protein [Candidatus Methylomirabilis sp.]|jgi:general secretion pathway protein G
MNGRGRTSRLPGFSLVELLIVVTILGILATIAIPMVGRAALQAREAALREDLYALRQALEDFHLVHDRYPTSLRALVEHHYLPGLPKDPITTSPDTWQVIYDSDAEGQPAGIIDVRSGSRANGSDGQRYADW